ncbi:endosomal integral membrane protein [Trypanosoma theileri]|uniref:Transmembrane 9 superfamily member n=1 Tax=Trypanosoma theileri TaxID=67003 RepID=A0A1X0PA12_9TRYP|nr:endosomal integral membrane protein [Trypanosoma theileri]ORC93777.1 endosomal integral membrane protein [Trypanosoma theileri]
MGMRKKIPNFLAYSCFFTVLLLLVSARGGSCALFGNLPSVVAYQPGTEIPITVNSLTSQRGLLPFDFYSVKTCQPDKQRMHDERVKENLGEIILGNRILPSEYSVTVGRNVSCQFVCTVKYEKSDMKHLSKLIDQYYRAHMFLAGLPLLEKSRLNSLSRRPRLGYRLGVSKKASVLSKVLINNHLHFTVTYVPLEMGGYSITGFYVTPSSVKSESGCPSHDSISAETPPPVTSDDKEITYSYSVSWEMDNDESFLTTRWDLYARAGRSATKRGHWMAILNSLALLSFLGILVMIVLARTVRKDLLIYGDADLTEDAQEESGWKLVRGDVFRTPPYSLLLTAFISTGSQMLLMALVTVLSAFLGVLHPSQRGNLLTSLIIFFCFASCISGYVAGRMLKFFRKQSWKNGFAAVTLVPGCMLLGYLLGNFISWTKHASTALPFGTLVGVLLLWVAVPIPLAFLGLSAGFHAEVLSVPTKVGSIPRMVTERSLNKRILYVLGGGLVPFTAAFVEVVYILGSFWKGEPFHYFGFLAGIGVVIAFICAEVAVVVTYTMLSEEDYQWWWGSFLSSGSCGLYFFGYSLVYLFSVLEIRQILSMILFCLYTTGVSLLIGMVMGTMGFFASAFFVRTIYGAIKAD